MVKKVILAVAGSRKTYHICHTINTEKRNLILAFTNANVANIKKELLAAFGSIPRLTEVLTFDAFVYRNFILPYERTIRDFFDEPNFKSRGITTVKPPKNERYKKSQKKNNENGEENDDPNISEKQVDKLNSSTQIYITKDKLGHYTTKSGKYYCDTLSELVIYIKGKKGKSHVKSPKYQKLMDKAIRRLELFYDYILVDEFQDFRKFDFDLLMGLRKGKFNLVMVGDFFQHSVSAVNNSGRPFENNNTLELFVEFLQSKGFEVDQFTLLKSRRCSHEICNFVFEKLKIPIESERINVGTIKWTDGYVKEIIENDKIVKLFFKRSNEWTSSSKTWSYSKGDTYDSVCVVLTEDFEKLDKDSFDIEDIKESTRNKLYVALTRTKGDLYLVRYSAYKRYLEDKYNLNPDGEMKKYSWVFSDQPSLFDESELPMGPNENR